ncbi:prepilin-type N-terminal cleavage/methylation domain-containing protein [Candidatus Gracilibacteria bacterium]|nr:prepilin-type N-terminal cleavage/methylation domain-containing protein [Candidatus Gracilibacteria bacterium]
MLSKTKYQGFTLVEMIIAIVGFFILMVVVLAAYMQILNVRDSVDARQNLIQESYYTMEKFNIFLKDFRIDYEEYFNRGILGCNSSGTDFSRDVSTGGYCNIFTNYGNGNNTNGPSDEFSLYYCSSSSTASAPIYVFTGGEGGAWTGCAISGYQSFGQYEKMFRDVKNDVDTITSPVGDEDDENMGEGPDAILNSTGVQELYLISQDKTQRIFLRRFLVESGDRNGNGVISGDTEYRYNIQILRLKGLDAGSNHNFDITNSVGVYDGVVDTRVCDADYGFVCNGSGVGQSYSGFSMPLDSNDGWVNLFPKNVTIADRNISVFPTKDPKYAWREGLQINPYFTINFNSKLYGEIRRKRIGDSIEDFNLNLQTTFNTKSVYTK